MSTAANNGLQQCRDFEPPALLQISLFSKAFPFRHRHPPLADAIGALRLTSILLVLFWTLPQKLEGQSLAEVARSERSRRAQLPHAAVTYSNEALEDYAGRSSASSSGRMQADPARSRSARPGGHPGPTREERLWSRRFLQLKARLAAAEQRHQALQLKLNDLNLKLQGDPFRQTTVADPAHVYGPLIARAKHEIERSRQVLSSARQELADLRERLRKSGKPLSWEDSQAAAALRPAGGPADGTEGSLLRDRAYWQRQLSLVDQRFRSRIAPLEIERFQLVHRRMPRKGESLDVDSIPGLGLPPGVADIDRRIRQLRGRKTEEKQALVEHTLRSGALPGWFR